MSTSCHKAARPLYIQKSQNGLNDCKGLANINYATVKHGETLYGHHTNSMRMLRIYCVQILRDKYGRKSTFKRSARTVLYGVAFYNKPHILWYQIINLAISKFKFVLSQIKSYFVMLHHYFSNFLTTWNNNDLGLSASIKKCIWRFFCFDLVDYGLILSI